VWNVVRKLLCRERELVRDREREREIKRVNERERERELVRERERERERERGRESEGIMSTVALIQILDRKLQLYCPCMCIQRFKTR
jgi:hypothetical protein